MLEFSDKELEAFEKIMYRKRVDVDESGRYIGFYIQVKLLGVMTFRIMHSHDTWIKLKRIFSEFDIDVESFPDWTSKGDQINGAKWYKKNVLGSSNVWDALVGIPRRERKGIRMFDLEKNLG